MPVLTFEFLGCGDAFGSGGRFHSCGLLAAAGSLTLVDCGASTPVALQKRGIDPGTIGAIVLTHLHGDHFGGVPFLLLDAAYNRPRAAPLVIAGPAGVEQQIADAADMLFPGTSDRIRAAVPVSFVEWQPLVAHAIGRLAVTAYSVRHSSGVEAYALRIEHGGAAIAFSGDTEWTPALAEVSRGADLFVCECTAYTAPLPGHLSLETLRAHASELTARRIVLTHLGREMLRHVADAPWECAEDGLTIEITVVSP